MGLIENTLCQILCMGSTPLCFVGGNISLKPSFIPVKVSESAHWCLFRWINCTWINLATISSHWFFWPRGDTLCHFSCRTLHITEMWQDDRGIAFHARDGVAISLLILSLPKMSRRLANSDCITIIRQDIQILAASKDVRPRIQNSFLEETW